MSSKEVLIHYDYSDENGLFLLSGIAANQISIKINIYKQVFVTYKTIIDDVSNGKYKKIDPVPLTDDDFCRWKIKMTAAV